MKRTDLEIRANFFKQLTEIEPQIIKMSKGIVSTNWNEIFDDPKNLGSEELILRNTFLNTRISKIEDLKVPTTKEKVISSKTISWCDEGLSNLPISQIYAECMLSGKNEQCSTTKLGTHDIKSILKVNR